ncbi:MAG: hypothetical protein ACRCWQ_01025 [Bacilli bacterium]
MKNRGDSRSMYSKVFSEKVDSSAPYQMTKDMLYIRGNRPKATFPATAVPREQTEELPPQDIAMVEQEVPIEVDDGANKPTIHGFEIVESKQDETVMKYEVILRTPLEIEIYEGNVEKVLEIREADIVTLEINQESDEMRRMVETVTFFENRLHPNEIQSHLQQIIEETYLMIQKWNESVVVEEEEIR